jgi:hypothetical protein
VGGRNRSEGEVGSRALGRRWWECFCLSVTHEADDDGAGNIWTTSGVAAGMDGMLAFIAHLYGDEFATNEANSVEYDWHKNATWDPFAAIWNVTGA